MKKENFGRTRFYEDGVEDVFDFLNHQTYSPSDKKTLFEYLKKCDGVVSMHKLFEFIDLNKINAKLLDDATSQGFLRWNVESDVVYLVDVTEKSVEFCLQKQGFETKIIGKNQLRQMLLDGNIPENEVDAWINQSLTKGEIVELGEYYLLPAQKIDVSQTKVVCEDCYSLGGRYMETSADVESTDVESTDVGHRLSNRIWVVCKYCNGTGEIVVGNSKLVKLDIKDSNEEK